MKDMRRIAKFASVDDAGDTAVSEVRKAHKAASQPPLCAEHTPRGKASAIRN
jgi:hypothetical protein